MMKAAGFGVVLVVLGLLGSGVFDRWLGPRPAAAAMGTDHPRSRHEKRREREPEVSVPAVSATSAEMADETPQPAASSSASAHGSAPVVSSKTPDGKLILNLASVEDLDALPGIGASKAKAIVDLRTKLGGRFKRLEDLMRVRGIKRKFLDRLRPLVVLDAPAAKLESGP